MQQKEAQRSGHYFPFILLSGFLDKDVVIQAVDVGVFRLLEKPTEYTLLLHTIDQLMIEHDVYKVRKEIRSLSSQLRELYTGIRLALLQHIPAETLNRIIRPANAKQDNSGKTMGIVKDESFEELLERLETRLEKLIASEKILDEMRVNKLRNPMKSS
jgi:YesN/AraC family two-component response regulator